MDIRSLSPFPSNVYRDEIDLSRIFTRKNFPSSPSLPHRYKLPNNLFIPRANYGREYKNVPSNLPSSDNFLRLSAKSYLEMGAWVDGAGNSSGDTRFRPCCSFHHRNRWKDTRKGGERREGRGRGRVTGRHKVAFASIKTSSAEYA